MTTNIQKWGNSQGLRIPKILLESLKWTEGVQLEMILGDGEITLRPVKAKRRSIQELFANYQGDYQPSEIDWGEPEGNEIW
ncbi:MAG: AbrB/MazE/SpoVT family DNA-binding domain-containing protein [Oscillospiraceae bacterium]|nr:AbrB/MazE/SpoVT family DNA-binding domain-containing protein [Oscillospiraceae bacterium]